MADARVAMSAVMRAFGVPATVTRPAPDNAPVDTTIAWVNSTTDSLPAGITVQRAEQMKVMSITKTDDLPDVPKRTLIVAPEIRGGADKTWRVDATLGIQFDELRVLVIEV